MVERLSFFPGLFFSVSQTERTRIREERRKLLKAAAISALA